MKEEFKGAVSAPFCRNARQPSQRLFPSPSGQGTAVHSPANVKITLLDSVGDIPHCDADLQADGFPAPVAAMAEVIKSADGIIIVTPEYNYSIPGVLRNALDWLSRHPDTPIAGKPVSVMSGSPGPIAGTRARYHLRQVLVFLDAIPFTKPGGMIGGINAKVDVEAGTITDETTRGFVTTHLQAFADFAKREPSLNRWFARRATVWLQFSLSSERAYRLLHGNRIRTPRDRDHGLA
jgi:chromate reductase